MERYNLETDGKIPLRKIQLRNLGVDGWITVKWIFKKW